MTDKKIAKRLLANEIRVQESIRKAKEAYEKTLKKK